MRWAEFLADTPPGVTEEIEVLFKEGNSFAVNEKDIKVTDADIQIHCDAGSAETYAFSIRSPY